MGNIDNWRDREIVGGEDGLDGEEDEETRQKMMKMGRREVEEVKAGCSDGGSSRMTRRDGEMLR